MVTSVQTYESELLFKLVAEMKDLHQKHKELLHAKHKFSIINRVSTKRDLIKQNKSLTLAGKFAVKLLKSRDKVVAKQSNTHKTVKTIMVKIKPELAEFLELKKRRLPTDVYIATAATSFFTNYITAHRLKEGKYVKLNDTLRKVFGEQLKKLGTGPDVKNPDGTVTKTAVLDQNGIQINPLDMTKHMTILSDLYPHIVKEVDPKTGKPKRQRLVVKENENQAAYALLTKEADLLINVLSEVRKRYEAAIKKLASLSDTKDSALAVGDNDVNLALTLAHDELIKTRREYVSLMNKHGISHSL